MRRISCKGKTKTRRESRGRRLYVDRSSGWATSPLSLWKCEWRRLRRSWGLLHPSRTSGNSSLWKRVRPSLSTLLSLSFLLLQCKDFIIKCGIWLNKEKSFERTSKISCFENKNQRFPQPGWAERFWCRPISGHQGGLAGDLARRTREDVSDSKWVRTNRHKTKLKIGRMHSDEEGRVDHYYTEPDSLVSDSDASLVR